MAQHTSSPIHRAICDRVWNQSENYVAKALGVSRKALNSYRNCRARNAQAEQIESRAAELGWLDGPGTKATPEGRAETERIVARHFGRVR